MDADTIWGHIDTQRTELADLLGTLTPDQWDTPSLCAGWTVRDVGAHLAMAQSRLGDVLWPLLRSGFNFNRLILRTALDSPATPAEIVATLRGFVGSRRQPPFVTEMEPLIDVIVHTQDICVPLGIERTAPADACAASADRIVALNRNPMLRLRRPMPGVRLRATDTDWSSGEGAEVSGPILALVMLLAGRESAALPRLTGVESLP
jgi:uncharacterized protein (TIGR03083 family)